MKKNDVFLHRNNFIAIENLKRLVLYQFFINKLFENLSEPSRAFLLKARAKTEASLGSGATLVVAQI